MVISPTNFGEQKYEEGEGMQELRDGASSAQEAEAQGCGSVRAGFHWAKAGNSPRFSR